MTHLKATVRRSSLSGTLQAPPSKSYTHRAIFCAALAHGESRIESPLICDDTQATAEALSTTGVMTDWTIGNSCLVKSEGLKEPTGLILCRDSGTTMRFMTAVCATTPYQAEISGGPSLLNRPVGDLTLALERLGARCESDQGHPPVRVRGPLKGGYVKIPGDISSQYVSALLLAAPFAIEPVRVDVLGRLESESYVKMTLEMQARFGVRVDADNNLSSFRVERGEYTPSNVRIEGDWSAAALLLGGALMAGERVRISGLAHNSLQADRCMVRILERMNARVSQDSNSLTVEKSDLTPLEVDVSNCPDLFPALSVLAAVADGVSCISGIRRLRIKESNRVLAMRNGLKEMGIKTEEEEDRMLVHGDKPHEAVVNPHNDHRIAMAFAALGLCTGEVTILDAECVGKSYPSFWSDLQSLGAEVTID